MRTLSPRLIASCLAALSLIAAGPVSAKPSETPESPDQAPAQGEPSEAERYCANIADAAADARLAWQMQALRELEEQVEKRLADLDARQAEFEDWLRRREEFVARAKETLVAVYANMRPDAAAEQLAILEDEEAASVLANLVPRAASAILNEMEPERAAQLAVAMAGPTEKREE